jgi:two-component system, OmpR family, sensor kinase
MSISIRQRLTLWYTAAVSVLLGTIALSLIAVHARLTLLRLDTELQRLNSTVAFVLQNELAERHEAKAAAEDALNEAILTDRHIAIFSRDGTLLVSRWSLPDAPVFPGVDNGVRTWTVATPHRFRVVAASAPPVPPEFVVVTAASWDELTDDRNTIARSLILVFPAALIVAAAGAWWVAGRAVRPAVAMADQARQITDQSPQDRLTVLRNDELGQLATAFNGLLDRLDAALDSRRRFLADASHELRTPVSIARTAADVALSREARSEAEYRDSLTVVSDQMKRLGRMVADMLLMARTDGADWPLTRNDFYLDDLVTEVERAGRLLAAERGIAVDATCPPDLEYHGDEGLLRQMLLNVVENAVRHSPTGGAVRLTADVGAQEIGVSIHDTGAGISDGDRDRIFDRFVRIDPTGNGNGLGLGLAIARRIARAHGGDLQLASTGPRGTTFRVTLPLASTDLIAR